MQTKSLLGGELLSLSTVKRGRLRKQFRFSRRSAGPLSSDLYSFSFLLLACSSPCLGLGLLLLISGGGGLGAFSGGSQEPFGPPPRCGVRRERVVGMSFFCVQKGSFPPSWGFFCCLCGCCYWVAFLDEIKDGDARSLLPLPTPECSGRCSFIMLSTAWRTHGVDSCGDSKAWSYSLVSAGGLLPGFNARCFFDMDWSGGERRRLVLFSGHGVAFFVICVISMVLIVKRICILLPDGI
jgi:hypothetical protein